MQKQAGIFWINLSMKAIFSLGWLVSLPYIISSIIKHPGLEIITFMFLWSILGVIVTINVVINITKLEKDKT
ncbi:MAG: hypothetical protein IPP96_08585 [Chitinophagaceae bacterium]|nr:hypothetical protein [Chitinophagaceae bacterium]